VDVFDTGLAWAGEVCLALPEAYEEAWVGMRWRIRSNTFAHVLEIVNGYPPAFAAAAGTDGPATVLTLRPPGHELAAVLAEDATFGPLWSRGDVGVRLDLQGARDTGGRELPAACAEETRPPLGWPERPPHCLSTRRVTDHATGRTRAVRATF
jgi:hypothetical protein